MIENLETSAAEAGMPWSDAGPLAWISYSDDPGKIEFIQYADPAIDRTLHRRVIKAERIGTQWNTVKLNLAAESTVLAQISEFDPADFDPRDFAA